ncbi:MAG TPA: hypothetical protein VG871_07055, partial [Vicinamibacterales bacterium]|nr:hypothetical protein [Vicinamibacterales bacterium]
AIVPAVTVSQISEVAIKEKRLFNPAAEEAFLNPVLPDALDAGSRPLRRSPVPPPVAGGERTREGAKRARHQ